MWHEPRERHDRIVFSIFLGAVWLLIVLSAFELLFYLNIAFGRQVWALLVGSAIIVVGSAICGYFAWLTWRTSPTSG